MLLQVFNLQKRGLILTERLQLQAQSAPPTMSRRSRRTVQATTQSTLQRHWQMRIIRLQDLTQATQLMGRSPLVHLQILQQHILRQQHHRFV